MVFALNGNVQFLAAASEFQIRIVAFDFGFHHAEAFAVGVGDDFFGQSGDGGMAGGKFGFVFELAVALMVCFYCVRTGGR